MCIAYSSALFISCLSKNNWVFMCTACRSEAREYLLVGPKRGGKKKTLLGDQEGFQFFQSESIMFQKVLRTKLPLTRNVCWALVWSMDTLDYAWPALFVHEWKGERDLWLFCLFYEHPLIFIHVDQRYNRPLNAIKVNMWMFESLIDDEP